MCYTSFENGVIESLNEIEKRIDRIEERMYVDAEMGRIEKEKKEKKELKMWGEE